MMENRSDLALAVQFGNERCNGPRIYLSFFLFFHLWHRLELTVDAESDLADLRGLLFSLTSLPPQRQRVSPLPAFCPAWPSYFFGTPPDTLLTPPPKKKQEDTPLSKLFMDVRPPFYFSLLSLCSLDQRRQQGQTVTLIEADSEEQQQQQVLFAEEDILGMTSHPCAFALLLSVFCSAPY